MISAGAAIALRFVRPSEGSHGDDPEFSSVLRIADPISALHGGGVFLPPVGLEAPAWLAAWTAWRDAVFTETLAPALEAVARHAALGEAREIRALDLSLTDALAPAEAARSIAVGRLLYDAMSGVRGERWLTKLQTWAADGSMASHFAVAYACRYASFHLPGRLLLPTYAYWEWSAARRLHPPASGALPEYAAVIPPPLASETALRANSRD